MQDKNIRTLTIKDMTILHIFYEKHGRWPTWADAIAHCLEHIKAHWKSELTRLGAWDAS